MCALPFESLATTRSRSEMPASSETNRNRSAGEPLYKTMPLYLGCSVVHTPATNFSVENSPLCMPVLNWSSCLSGTLIPSQTMSVMPGTLNAACTAWVFPAFKSLSSCLANASSSFRASAGTWATLSYRADAGLGGTVLAVGWSFFEQATRHDTARVSAHIGRVRARIGCENYEISQAASTRIVFFNGLQPGGVRCRKWRQVGP